MVNELFYFEEAELRTRFCYALLRLICYPHFELKEGMPKDQFGFLVDDENSGNQFFGKEFDIEQINVEYLLPAFRILEKYWFKEKLILPKSFSYPFKSLIIKMINFNQSDKKTIKGKFKNKKATRLKNFI